MGERLFYIQRADGLAQFVTDEEVVKELIADVIGCGGWLIAAGIFCAENTL